MGVDKKKKMYAIICSEKTRELWPKALLKLEEKYEAQWPGGVQTILYTQTTATSVRSCLGRLSAFMPRFSCFLTHHSQCSREFVQQVNRLTRELNESHPYSDTIWGILTGLTEEDVVSALDHDPLKIGRVIGNCPVDLEKFRSGVWFSEFKQGMSYCKAGQDDPPLMEECPHDTTGLIVQELSEERAQSGSKEMGVDMIISSGHATEEDWNIAYCFKGGKFLCERGQLYGLSVAGERLDLQRSKTPKILSAAGNCLMAHISDEHCMALGWMHSANVVQMVGYVEPTWFGYGGWGVHKYFVNNPGSMSFAEAFFANQQSLLYELHSEHARHMGTSLEDHRSVYDRCFNTSSSAREDLSRECSGLIYDRDNVVFYGDPAWRAELETNLDVYHFECSLQELPPPTPSDQEAWHYWRFGVKVLRPGRWDCPIPDDKETCPGRPPVYVFPQRLLSPQVLEGEAVVTELFLLLPLKGECKAGQCYSVLLRSKK